MGRPLRSSISPVSYDPLWDYPDTAPRDKSGRWRKYEIPFRARIGIVEMSITDAQGKPHQKMDSRQLDAHRRGVSASQARIEETAQKALATGEGQRAHIAQNEGTGGSDGR